MLICTSQLEHISSSHSLKIGGDESLQRTHSYILMHIAPARHAYILSDVLGTFPFQTAQYCAFVSLVESVAGFPSEDSCIGSAGSLDMSGPWCGRLIHEQNDFGDILDIFYIYTFYSDILRFCDESHLFRGGVLAKDSKRPPGLSLGTSSWCFVSLYAFIFSENVRLKNSRFS